MEKTLVIEVKYVDTRPKKKFDGIVSQYSLEHDCREKLSQAISQLYDKNYFDAYANPLPLAIVIDESRDARISHAAFDKVAYRIDDKPPIFIPIGNVYNDGKHWKITWTSDISASKEPLSFVDVPSVTSDISLATSPPTKQETDLDSIAADLIFCQFVLPIKQYLAWKDAIKRPDSESIKSEIRKLKQTIVSLQSALSWHSLTQDNKATAFQDAVRTDASITLRYTTPDGIFRLIAIDLINGEAIGLLITSTCQAAYGTYPLSRLRENASSLWTSDTPMPLRDVCMDQGINVSLPLPTPQQLLQWEK
jgi:hypothetical protein